MAELTAYLVAWGEILAGLGIIVGGIIANSLSELGHLITRVSGGAIGVIMICSPDSSLWLGYILW